MGLLPDELQDPYPDTVEYFTSIEEKMRKHDDPFHITHPPTSDRKQPSAALLSLNDASSHPRMRPSKS